VRSLSSKREQYALRSFFRGNREDLRNVLLGAEEERRAFRQDVIDAIKWALESLDRDCRDDPAAPTITMPTSPSRRAALSMPFNTRRIPL